MINFDLYQEKVKGFMNPKVLESSADTFLNALLGLGGEVGEMQDAVKKAWYHDGDLDLEKLDKEAGDVLFYITLYCISRNRNLSDIAQLNIDKLTKRYDGKPWSAEASKAKRDEHVEGLTGTCAPGAGLPSSESEGMDTAN